MNPSASNPPKNQVIFWFSLSLAFAMVYSLIALDEAFSNQYIVQDDARQHVFWMQRFFDPSLFPDDLIANYFQSVAPAGYTTLYRLIGFVGIHPLLLNKLLPMVLGLITTSYCFGLCLQMLPIPAAGFIASLLLNQTLWMLDDLVSATPRAFIYPLLLAFLYYLSRRSLIPCLVVITLQGLFYPQCVFLCCGVLVLKLLCWREGKIRLSSQKNDYWFCAAGLGVAFIVLLPYALTTSDYGPIISAQQAKTMAEFEPGGRVAFFDHNPWDFWLEDARSGLFPRRKRLPIAVCAGLLLPILLRFPSWLPLVKKVKGETVLLTQLALVSLGMFIMAHAVLFRLHLPSRYSKHSLRIVLVLAAAIAIILLLDAIIQACQRLAFPPIQGKPVLGRAIVTLVGIALILSPLGFHNFPKTNYEVGRKHDLYEFFAKQPNDILIASLSKEADFLPTFSGRSVLVSREYGIPYHTNYYNQFRNRAIDLIQAQYSPNLAEVKHFIRQYGIDFWLLDKTAFNPQYIADNRWIMQYQPVAAEAQARLKQAIVPAIVNVIDSCSVFDTEKVVVLDTECIAITSNS